MGNQKEVLIKIPTWLHFGSAPPGKINMKKA